MSPRTALRVLSLAPIVTAVCLVTLPAAALAQASKGAGEVVEGAKKIGKGVEETAKGIGKTVSEGAKEVGHRAADAGKETKPAVDKMHDSAKGFGESIWGGMKSAGRSIKRFFTGS
jgi:hypothetical protein